MTVKKALPKDQTTTNAVNGNSGRGTGGVRGMINNRANSGNARSQPSQFIPMNNGGMRGGNQLMRNGNNMDFNGMGMGGSMGGMGMNRNFNNNFNNLNNIKNNNNHKNNHFNNHRNHLNNKCTN